MFHCNFVNANGGEIPHVSHGSMYGYYVALDQDFLFQQQNVCLKLVYTLGNLVHYRVNVLAETLAGT